MNRNLYTPGKRMACGSLDEISTMSECRRKRSHGGMPAAFATARGIHIPDSLISMFFNFDTRRSEILLPG